MHNILGIIVLIAMSLFSIIGFESCVKDPVEKIIKDQRVCTSVSDKGVKFEKCWKLVEE